MEVLRTAILDFGRRKKGEGFTPSEVVQQLYPEDWEQFLPDLLEEVTRMTNEGLIEVTFNHDPIARSKSILWINMLSKPK